MNPPRTLELWPKDCPHHCEQPHGLPRIDIHIPPADAPARTRGGTGRPILLVCPGGGYQGNAEHEGTPIARLAAAHGIVGAVCWYRVAPHGWPAGYADAARAIRLLRSMSAELRADPHRLALMGFSAGGHNVCMLATDPDEHLDPRDDLADRHAAAPDRLILGYAVTSFVHDAHIGSMRNLLGDRADAHAVRKHYSAECRVTEHTPPTFLFHADRDPGVPLSHSLRFADALHQAGVPLEMHILPGAAHGFGLAEGDPHLSRWADQLFAWLADWD